MKRSIILCIILLSCISINAQTDANQSSEYCNFCFRGNPKPNCCSFLVFESGWMFNMSRSGERQDKEDFVITGDFGLMFNINNSKALGATFHIAGDDDGTRFGIGPRYRVWYKNNVALDLSPRLMFGGSDNYVRRKFPGFSLTASLSIKDLISIDSYLQMIRYETVEYYSFGLNPRTVDDTETGLYFGFSGRSYLAPAIPAFALILAAATFN